MCCDPPVLIGVCVYVRWDTICYIAWQQMFSVSQPFCLITLIIKINWLVMAQRLGRGSGEGGGGCTIFFLLEWDLHSTVG